MISFTSAREHQSILQQSASSNSLAINKSNRKFLVFCAFVLTLLLGSSLQLAYSYLPTYDRRAYQKAFIGKRFFRAAEVLQVRSTTNVVHEVRSADIHGDEALHCDRSHYRTDVCVARGDVRVLGGTAHGGGSYQVLVFAEHGHERIEKLKPYTRKWETSVMKTIDEVMLIKKVLANRSRLSTLNTNSIHLNPRHVVGHSTRISFLRQQSRAAMARCNPSAQLHRRLLARIINPAQQKRRASKQRHQKGQLHVRANDSSGNYIQLLQQLQPERRSSVLRGDQLSMRQGAHQISDHPARYQPPACQVQHEVPAILFSTGGYTGNVYHEFNDGLMPLFITAQQYPPGGVVLVVLEYHDWWMSKYAEVVAQISNYKVIDLAHDRRVHCFAEVTVGLRIHGELAIHAENNDNASMQGFQAMLRAAYGAGKQDKKGKRRREARSETARREGRKLVLMSRSSPRALLNEEEVIELAKEIGFTVEVVAPTPRTRVEDIYMAVSGCEVMVGVHGAAMTHLVFMRPGATLIQVVPLGTEWAAATYYGEPAQKLGLNYVAYKVSPTESSLSLMYGPADPVLVSPESVNQKGWSETKRIYLQQQDITLSLPRLRVTLLSAYAALTA